MQRLLILSIVFLNSFNISAQCFIHEPYTGNTGANMTVVLLPAFMSSLPEVSSEPYEAYISAFTENGTLVGSVYFNNPESSDDLSTGQGTIAVWGDDSLTPDIDGATSGATISFHLVNGAYFYDLTHPTVSYIPSGLHYFNSLGSFTQCVPPVYGCMGPEACNYDESATDEDWTCLFPDECNECNNDELSLIDTNTNGVCDLYDIGCMDSSACNYNPEATEDFDLCIYSTDLDACASCSGETDGTGVIVDNDLDNDGVCDWDEIGGGCDIPEPYIGNTGINMTVMLTSAFMSSLPEVSSEPYEAYIVALSNSGDVIGSVYFSNPGGTIPDLSSGQGMVAVWGDDYLTPELDGATSGATISFQLVDGSDLYDVIMPSPVSYTSYGISPQFSAATSSLVDCSVAEDVLGCMDSAADNFDAAANVNSGCLYTGCMDLWADNYDVNANIDDGTCYLNGCTSNWADNYNINATINDGSCELTACPYSYYFEYDSNYTNADISMCTTFIIEGCTNIDAQNYNSEANLDDGTCIIIGCMQQDAYNYNPEANIDGGNCIYFGCTSPIADNFNPIATNDDGLCIIGGCMLSVFSNYNPQATYDNGSCSFSVYGCTDVISCNYNSEATEDDGSCLTAQEYYDCEGNCLSDSDSDGVCDELEIVGCQDILSMNYDSLATDSGPCDISWYEYQQMVSTQIDSLELEIENNIYASIIIDLLPGWNMIGYTLPFAQDVTATLASIVEQVEIVKNNEADVYWPEFGFNGIGDFIPGQGYQIRMFEGVNGYSFPDVDGQRIELTPTIPQWAIDMEAQIHPNDIRTLVRVVNMLGQEVNPENQPSGTVLLYLYNDATVEKKIK